MMERPGGEGPVGFMQRKVCRRSSLTSNRSNKSLNSHGSSVSCDFPQDVAELEENFSSFAMADDLEAGFAAEAFMAKSATSPSEARKAFRRCCIFHVGNAQDEFHLLSEAGDHLLTARFLRQSNRIDFFVAEEESTSPRKELHSPTNTPKTPRRPRAAFSMCYNENRDNWVLKQTTCEHCIQRPRHLSCESLGQGQQVAFIQHSMKPVGKARVHFIDVRIPPMISHYESVVWCPVSIGRDLCDPLADASPRRRLSRQHSYELASANGLGDLVEETSSQHPSDDSPSPKARSLSKLQCRDQCTHVPVHACTFKPVWDAEVESLVLNFKDRTVQSSPMNFILCIDAGQSPHAILQHAKMCRNTYCLDFRHPLSTVQAFAVALTGLVWD